jgi:putative membrane protein
MSVERGSPRQWSSGEPAAGARGRTGNRARDHLANERTYLAWLRTSLAVVAAGAFLVRLTDSRTSRTVAASAVTVTFGVLALAYGTIRYYRVARQLDNNHFEPARRAPLVLALAVLVGLGIVLPLLLA